MHLFTALAQLALFTLPTLASPVIHEATSNFEGRATNGRYIIKLKDGVDRATHVQSLPLTKGSSVLYEYDIINGFAGTFNNADLSRFKADENVEYIEEDGIATINGFECNNPWGLNRISTGYKLQDQDPSQLSFAYTFGGLGEGIDVFMVDTGILTSHPAFQGRAVWGKTFGGYPDIDDNGHGTHTAGTAISYPYGVAQHARAIAVKVIGASGTGTIADVVAGLQWVGTNVSSTGRRGLVSMSLGGGLSQSWDDAVRSLINSNIPVVVAAGNSDQDASLSSPSDVQEAIVVGASDITDTRAYFSNFGATVDLFAPGVSVISTFNNGSTASYSGTSMATPHAAGQAAVYLATHHGATPAQVSKALTDSALRNQLSNIPAGTANLLLNNENRIPNPFCQL